MTEEEVKQIYDLIQKRNNLSEYLKIFNREFPKEMDIETESGSIPSIFRIRLFPEQMKEIRNSYMKEIQLITERLSVMGIKLKD